MLLILLAWWRKPIFTRLERESESSEPVQRMLQHRKGVRSFGSAANGAFWLLANNLRRSLMRSFLRVGDGHGISFTGSSANSNNESVATAQAGISDDVRSALLTGSSGFDKYARTERRRLIRRANNGQSGVIAVVGERGIGKGTVLKDVVENLFDTAICLNVRPVSSQSWSVVSVMRCPSSRRPPKRSLLQCKNRAKESSPSRICND